MATKKEYEEAKWQAKIDELQVAARKNIAKNGINDAQKNIEILNTYVQYGAGRLVGIASSVVGAMELLSPDTIHYATPHPELILGGGVSLLAGKAVLAVFRKLLA